ncbi:MAG: RNA ligase, Rnl2 family [Chitinophagales bacterium]
MFKKYNSIENTYRTEFLNRIKGHGFWEDEFVVQEKTHGANLSYWTDNGVDFYAGKRTGKIEEKEAFYNYEIILGELKPKFMRIWDSLKIKSPDLLQMTIFGELIGGNYPHPEVTADKKAMKVQKGVYYSPQNHFYAFDILLNSEKYVDVEEANVYFEKEELLYAKTLFKGSFSECLEYRNSFPSTVPAILGLPEIEDNICEGVVIRPAITSYFNNGTRVILKNKNETWAERKQFRKSIRKEEQLPEKIVKLREAISTYVTENRLNNVLSKIGAVTLKDFGKVMGLFSKDIVEDFLKDYEEVVNDLEKQEWKSVKKSISYEASGMVRNKLKRL